MIISNIKKYNKKEINDHKYSQLKELDGNIWLFNANFNCYIITYTIFVNIVPNQIIFRVHIRIFLRRNPQTDYHLQYLSRPLHLFYTMDR